MQSCACELARHRGTWLTLLAFAIPEMKLITAAVYSNYTTEIVDDTGIEQGDGYTGRPASERLWLRFEKTP